MLQVPRCRSAGVLRLSVCAGVLQPRLSTNVQLRTLQTLNSLSQADVTRRGTGSHRSGGRMKHRLETEYSTAINETATEKSFFAECS
jgi:hypothetical protein